MNARVLSTLIVVALPIAAQSVRAQDFPARTVSMVVPVSPGSGTDFVARLIAQNLASNWGKNVVVENRPGGGTLIGAAAVARAQPDGHTLLMMTNTTLANAAANTKMSFDPLKDLTLVALVADVPFVLVVNAALPVGNVKELIAYARSRPGELSYGSAGPGTMHHLSAEIFQTVSGTSMVHVPYGGSAPALTDLLANRIQLMFLPLGLVLPHVKAGKLRAIGLTTTQRVAAAPDIPTIAESGLPDFDAGTWQAVAATSGTPKEIVVKLNKSINDVVAAPDVKQQLLKIDMIPSKPAGPDQLQAFMRAEFGRLAAAVKKAGLVQSR